MEATLDPVKPSADHEPSAKELETAKRLYKSRVRNSRWRQLDLNSDEAKAYREACAIVSDQSNDLERLVNDRFESPVPQNRSTPQFGKPAHPTPVRDLLRTLFPDTRPYLLEMWARSLQFYSHRELVEFRWSTPHGVLDLRFVCVRPSHWVDVPLVAVPLTGTSPPIHQINAFESRATEAGFLNLNADNGHAEDYIQFFCAHVAVKDYYFDIVEAPKCLIAPLPKDSPLPSAHDIYQSDADVLFVRTNKDTTPHSQLSDLPDLSLVITPITKFFSKTDYLFNASLVHNNTLYRSVFRITSHGKIDMLDDDIRFESLPIEPLRTLNKSKHVLAGLIEKPKS